MKKIEDLHYKNVYYFENELGKILYGRLIPVERDRVYDIGVIEPSIDYIYNLELKNYTIVYIDEMLIDDNKLNVIKKYEKKAIEYLKEQKKNFQRIIKDAKEKKCIRTLKEENKGCLK